MIKTLYKEKGKMTVEKNKPDLRIAVMSDVHIGFTGHINPNYYGLSQPGDQDKWWEYALRAYFCPCRVTQA